MPFIVNQTSTEKILREHITGRRPPDVPRLNRTQLRTPDAQGCWFSRYQPLQVEYHGLAGQRDAGRISPCCRFVPAADWRFL